MEEGHSTVNSKEIPFSPPVIRQFPSVPNDGLAITERKMYHELIKRFVVGKKEKL